MKEDTAPSETICPSLLASSPFNPFLHFPQFTPLPLRPVMVTDTLSKTTTPIIIQIL